jgi:hypothetical protein
VFASVNSRKVGILSNSDQRKSSLQNPTHLLRPRVARIGWSSYKTFSADHHQRRLGAQYTNGNCGKNSLPQRIL